MSASTFFYWKRQFQKNDKDRQLKDIIKYIWNNDQHFGSLRITKTIRDNFDLVVNHKRVYRIMKRLGIYGKGYHKQTSKYDSSKGPEGNRVKNLLNRRFKAD
ncbi:IS3 family transposase, partial [Lentilactobacillus senioris]|uniref:IS3 family transposase n=1 Tax=Lentilactobacillus senioris TaxID=931534 RepID=UPI003AF25ECA